MEKVIDEIQLSSEWVHPLANKTIVFTGALVTMTRAQAAKQARQHGAIVTNRVTMETHFVVKGKERATKSAKEQAAQRCIAYGAALQMINEDDFLWLVSLA